MLVRRTVLFLVLAVLIATPCWSKVKVQEHTLPALDAVPYSPVVCGNWAIAQLNEKYSDGWTIGVVAYDLQAGKVYTVYNGKASGLALTGSLAIWSGNVDNVDSLRGTRTSTTINSHLITYDLVSGEFWSPKLNTVYANNASSSGDYVAYEYRADIYLYNLRTGKQKRISDGRRVHTFPSVGGDLVVWMENETEPKRLRVRGYRISTGEEYLFSEYEDSISRPETDGDYVVWHSKIGGVFYDVKTRKARIAKFALFPDVSDGIAVYEKPVSPRGEDTHATPRMVCGIDLRMGGQEFRISKSQDIHQVSMNGNRVVWAEGNTLHYADLTRM